MTAPAMNEFEDGSGMLGPGVYVLLSRGRVVFVGKAKSILATVAKHREFVRQSVPSWFPVQGIQFDEVLWKTSHPDRIDAEVTKLRRIHMRQGEVLEVA